MEIRTYELGPIGTNAYLLLNEATKEAAIIDAPEGTLDTLLPVIQNAGCQLTAILITHGHWDHTYDMERLRQTGAPTYAHAADKQLIENPAIMSTFMMRDIGLQASQIDHEIIDNETLQFLGSAVHILHVPGHCKGNVAFYFPEHKAIFTGDSLFAGSVGRWDLPGGNEQELRNSIKTKLYPLPDDTIVYPGHGPSSTLGKEKKTNSVVRA